MAHHRETIVPFPGRFGRRQPPYTRLFRGPRRRLGRSRPFRSSRRLVPWLPFLLCAVLAALQFLTDRHPGPPTAEAIREGPVWGAETISGRSDVIDGDTLRIGRTRIRLDGIDAPEADQTCRLPHGSWNCGEAAAARLRQLAGSHPVICEKTGTDSYGRILARCHIGDTDLAAEMVRAGLAMAYRQYSLRYLPQELGARLDRRNIWATDFMPPWEWRRLK